MKFFVMCDLLPAPYTAQDVQLAGMRLSGAAVDSPDDLKNRLTDVVVGKPLQPVGGGFDVYIKPLTDNCGPLFPWLGGTVKAALAYTQDEETPTSGSNPPDKGATDLASTPVNFPINDFGLSADSLAQLRHSALADLTLDKTEGGYKRTNKFTYLDPFRLTGWDNQDKPKRIEEVKVDEVDEDQSLFSYEAFMAGLASLPGPVPHGQLNLCQFATYTSPAAGAGKRCLVIAAPVFTLTNGVTREPDWQQTKWYRFLAATAPKQVMAFIPYKAVNNEPDIEVRCRAIDLSDKLESSNSFLDRKTLWVRRSQSEQARTPTTEGVAFEDWLGKLPELLADTFDLPRLLVQLMEQDAATADFPIAAALVQGSDDRRSGALTLARATLLSLRDIVGPGCIATDQSSALPGPNGSPAPKAVLDRVDWAVVDAGAKGLDEAARKDFARKVIAYDDDFRADDEEGDDQRWFTLLAGVLATSLDLATAGAQFVEDLADRIAIDPRATGPFDPAPLRRLVDTATLPASAAAIQVALWQEVRARKGLPQNVGEDDFAAWLNAAGPAFGRLADRGFRLVEFLRKANIDLPWTSKTGIWQPGDPATKDLDLLAANVVRSLIGYVHGTVCEPVNNPDPIEAEYEELHGRRDEMPSGARGPLADAVKKLYQGRIKKWFPTPQEEHRGRGGDALKAGLAPDAHAVALQIDRLVVGRGDSPDFNQDLAGYGLLMRRAQPNPEPWRSLTSTWAHIDPDGNQAVELIFNNASHAVLGALPVGYTADMPQAIVIYDNRPVIGDDLSKKPDVVLAQGDHRIFRLYQPAAQTLPDDDPSILPFLAYGAVFETAPFGISNHGAMPVAIRLDAYPAILDPTKLRNPVIDPKALRRFAYLRRTGVAPLRVAPDPTQLANQASSYHPMLLPKDVKPLAEEILVPNGALAYPQKADDKRLKPLKTGTALLLADKAENPLGMFGQLTLVIEAPATTLEDFDRWIALDEAMEADQERKKKFREFRKAVRSLHQERTTGILGLENELRKAKEAGDKDKQTQLQQQIDGLKKSLELQDPSVVGLVIVATRLRRDGKYFARAIDETKSAFFDWDWAWTPDMDPKDPFKDKRKPINLLCKVHQDASKPVFDETDRTAWVRPGDVAVVRFFAAVPDSRFSGNLDGQRRFDRSVLEKPETDGNEEVPNYVYNNKAYRLFSLHQLAVEAAWPVLPATTEIGDDKTEVEGGKVISASIVAAADKGADEAEGAIRLAFTRKPNRDMDAIGSVAVGSQAWRWTGRAIAPFPLHQTQKLNVLPAEKPDPARQSSADYALLWDVEGFAERLNETLDDQIGRVPITETITNNVSTPQPIRIALRTPGRDELARYMRFRIAAYNRYISAYRAAGYKDPDDPQWESKKAEWIRKLGGADPPAWSSDWYRVLRPASVPTLDAPAELPPPVVPKPGIRGMLPLTRAVRRSDATEDSVSGVLVIADGAWFEHAGLAEWMLARVEVAQRRSEMAAEMGPDPLVRTYGLGGSAAAPVPNPLIETVPLELAGPQGHGFDTGTATGLYLNSSFVVRAPNVVLKDPTAWWMGKLSFRRLILAEGTRDYWSKVQTVAYKLESDQKYPQASATFHEIQAAEDGTSSLRVKLSGKLGPQGSSDDASATVEATWSRQGWTFKLDNKPITGLVINEAKFDLRIIAARRVFRDDQGVPHPWYEILLLVRPWGKAWLSVWEARWFDRPARQEITAILALEITADGGRADAPRSRRRGARADAAAARGVTYLYRDSRDFQVSETTEGRWAQFLPNAEKLVRTTSVPLDKLQLTVAGQTKLSLSAEGGSFVWLGTDALMNRRTAGKEDQGLFNLLLVTKRVASVAGTEEEAYVGLYYSANGYGLAEASKSRDTIVLEWFGPGTPPPLSNEKLIGRIMTVRVGNLGKLNESSVRKWKAEPWGQFFPPEGVTDDPYAAPPDGSQVFGEKRPSDAPLQIIEIYAPIVS
jgi:hypothetical protein